MFTNSQVHGEVTDPEIDIFDRERVFIDTVLKPLIQKFPRLKVVMEHVTTMDAVKFVESCDEGHVAATVTPQHLLLNRNSIFQGGLQPHNYCLPVLKRETHRQAIVAAVTSGNKRFFLGTDSAPHDRLKKECACGCAGVFNAPVALSVYAKVFEETLIRTSKKHKKSYVEKDSVEGSRIILICIWKYSSDVCWSITRVAAMLGLTQIFYTSHSEKALLQTVRAEQFSSPF
ncbi:dihydroorotase, mitochondrial isoform X1 [Tanacetum coccineum]